MNRWWLICILFFYNAVYCQEVASRMQDYPNQVPGFCSNGSQFDCGGGQCILFQKVRDCTKDCPDGSDENCGTGLVLCDTVLASSGCGKCVQAGSESAYCQDQRYASLCSLPQNQRYQCTSTRNCVLNSWIMDGVNECGDFSDENPCLLNRTTCDSTSVCTFNTYTLKVICDCPAGVSVGGTSCTYVDPLISKIPGKCSINPLQFDCGDKCIDIKQFRDCRSDCSDGSDESCWLGTSKCSDACTCVPSGTENSNCPISAGQSLCQLPNTTNCALTSICVYNEWIVDGKNDCGDYSDEDACLQHRDNCDQNAVCVPNVVSSTFACKCQAGYAGDGVTCTSSSSNTSKIYSRIPGSCSMQPLQFDCGNGQCLPIEKFRDCVVDCPDGSDESCWTGQIKCDNCKCIDPNDAAQGCTDSSSLCPSPGMFHCASGGGCVYDEMVLDGTPNCPDGSDENYCSTILTNCPPGQKCVYAVNLHNFTCGCPSGSVQSGSVCQSTYNGQPKDCADYQTQSRSISGYGTFTVYYPSCVSAGSLCSTLQVPCDFTYDGGGWTIIQKRQNGQLDFYRTWNEYKNGFGSQDNEFWLGNEYVYQLTSTMGVSYELVILMTSIINMQITVRYNRFQLGSQYDFYRLTLGNMIQGDTDSLQPSRNQRFGTKDQDVDYDPGTSCGIWWRSGWWHDPYCFRTGDLNVPYDPVTGMAQLAGIVWTGVVKDARIRTTQMMIRPVGFRLSNVTTTKSTSKLTLRTVKPPIFANLQTKIELKAQAFVFCCVFAVILCNR